MWSRLSQEKKEILPFPEQRSPPVNYRIFDAHNSRLRQWRLRAVNVNSEQLKALLYPIEPSSLFLPLTRCSSANGSTATPIRFSAILETTMPAHHLSTLKWSDEGELSPQDTWNLVTKLTKTEDQSKASNLLHLSSKHSHAKSKKTHKNWTLISLSD